MKVGAIIAEYNPFHNGHKYQIEKFRKDEGLDYVIAIMSGNFVQRGEPACMPKHLRTKMALLGGADLILELPLYYATGSASIFAEGAVAHLDALGCVDSLCFGCEADTELSLHMNKLEQVANLLQNEPIPFKQKLSEYLKQGLSYPAAREKAMCLFFPDAPLIFEPNNILALEYILALKRMNSKIIPTGIKRLGPGYHSTDQEHFFASASALRQGIRQNTDWKNLNGLPSESFDLIHSYYGKSLPIFMDDFSQIFAALFLTSQHRLTDYLDFNEDISNLMLKKFDNYQGLSKFLMEVKNKSYTYSRLSRCAIHLITQQFSEDFLHVSNTHKAYYARILGFRRSSSPLLKKMKQTSKIPMITKLASYTDFLEGNGKHMLEMDLAAAQLYKTVTQIKFHEPSKNEFTENIVII